MDADGTAHFTLSGTYEPKPGFVVPIEATLTMSPNGQVVTGIAKFDLPWPCPDPEFTVLLIKRG